MSATPNSSALLVDVQFAASQAPVPDALPLESSFVAWAQAAHSAVAGGQESPKELTIRLVDDAEMAELNNTYRGKQGLTNVLSFPFEWDDSLADLAVDESAADLTAPILGDLVICPSVVVTEAKEQSKQIEHHYAHMVVHGVLHLCGYDHQDEQDAQEMESLEQTVMAALNMPDPY